MYLDAYLENKKQPSWKENERVEHGEQAELLKSQFLFLTKVLQTGELQIRLGYNYFVDASTLEWADYITFVNDKGTAYWLSDYWEYFYTPQPPDKIIRNNMLVIYGPLFLTYNYTNLENKCNIVPFEYPFFDVVLHPAGDYRLLIPHQDCHFISQRPFFFQDNKRTFFIIPKDTESPEQDEVIIFKRYLFRTFYHPYVNTFIKQLNFYGIDGLLNRQLQLLTNDTPLIHYQHTPNDLVEEDPKEDVDFEYDGAYSLYNWELFFHIPFMIADRLSKNQRFEEAQRWFHYIFDPTSTDTTTLDPNTTQQKYWITKPFYETTSEKYYIENIPNLLRYLADRNNLQLRNKLTPEQLKYIDDLPKRVAEWRDDPFKPHLVARMRTTAYQKAVVMKYIDNLIAWGDQLFRRDTMESINEATQLYILAADLLGRRPEQIPPRAIPEVHTYNTLEPLLDDFSNALVQIEDFVPPSAATASPPAEAAGTEAPEPEPSPPPEVTIPTMLYFCVPKNDKLLGYWDTVEDRLFKVRHCMNIEGVVRQLPLFEPPIDPALLVKAAAAGIDISSDLNDINAVLPHYRFQVMAQKVSELCAELKSLGAALLSALEKNDAEKLSLVRARHETDVLKSVELVRKKQIDEAAENLVALKRSRSLAETRYLHYQKLLGVKEPKIPAKEECAQDQKPSSNADIKDESGVKMIDHEKQELEKLELANDYQIKATGYEQIANILSLIPSGAAKPMGVGIEYGRALKYGIPKWLKIPSLRA